MTSVLHVTSSLSTGGAEMFLATLAPRLAERGIGQRVVSLTGGGGAADRLQASDIPVHELDARGVVRAMTTVRRLSRLISETRPDIVQGWMYHGDLFATLATRLVRPPRPRLIWNIRCSGMQLSDYSAQLGLVVKACAALSTVPDVVLANSEAGAEGHRAAGYRPRRMLVIPNGVDMVRFTPDAAARASVRAELGIAPDAVVVLHVARVDPMKDHAGFLKSASRLHGAVVVLVGRGTQDLDLPANARALGARSDIDRLLNGGDIIVSSSAYGEGFSNALAEGMAAGLVPVSTDVGDARVIVGDTGRVVAAHSVDALAHAMQEMVDLDDRARQGLKTAARERIAREFSLGTAVDRFAALYQSR